MPQVETIAQLHFDIVNGCQLSCLGCPTPVQKTKINWIDPDDFYSCLCNLDVKTINVFRLFNYGEPLLHPQLVRIGEALLKSTHLKFNIIELSTNAQRCNWDDFEALIKLNVITQIAVSCDGDGTQKSYESLRPPAKWKKLICFFERCSEIVATHSPATKLITRTIVNSQSDIRRWENTLKPYGFTPEFRGWKQLPEAKNMTSRQNDPGQGICSFVENRQRLFVNAHGDVVPCCAHPKASVFGNLMDSKFSEILNGNQRKQFTYKLATMREKLDICGQCEFGPTDNPGASSGVNAPT